jgi:hypothetical protein
VGRLEFIGWSRSGRAWWWWRAGGTERPAEFTDVAVSNVEGEKDHLSCVRTVVRGTGAVEFKRCPTGANESGSDQEAMRQGETGMVAPKRLAQQVTSPPSLDTRL